MTSARPGAGAGTKFGRTPDVFGGREGGRREERQICSTKSICTRRTCPSWVRAASQSREIDLKCRRSPCAFRLPRSRNLVLRVEEWCINGTRRERRKKEGRGKWKGREARKERERGFLAANNTRADRLPPSVRPSAAAAQSPPPLAACRPRLWALVSYDKK